MTTEEFKKVALLKNNFYRDGTFYHLRCSKCGEMKFKKSN